MKLLTQENNLQRKHVKEILARFLFVGFSCDFLLTKLSILWKYIQVIIVPWLIIFQARLEICPNKDKGMLAVHYRCNLIAASPIIRHPTDVSLPTTGEYTAYKGYKLSAPVTRLTVPDGAAV